jgi:putative transposase
VLLRLNVRRWWEHVFVFRSYRYRLYPTRRQQCALDIQLRFACELWNAALEQRRDAWRRCRESVGYHTQAKELTALRRHAPELLPPEGMNCWTQQAVLRRLDDAFSAFFRRMERGEKPGYPRFKAPERFSTIAWSFAGKAGGCAVTPQGRLRIQGVGEVKVKWHRRIPPDATLRELRVTRKGSGRSVRYYACFVLDVRPRVKPPRSGEAVGIDVGVRVLAALSTGERFNGPRAGANSAPQTRRAARRVARKRRGSARRRRAAQHLARQREREALRRRDAAHKLSRKLVDRFAFIAHEDLRLMNMLRSPRGTAENPGRGVRAKAALNREIADQGWGMLFSMLAYKAEDAGGRVVRVDPAGTSQSCARCGAKDRRSRSGARFSCVHCGHQEDADVNAATVILQRALDVEQSGPGGAVKPKPLLLAVA